ncbi:MAG: DUF3379 family protein [Pseudomonadota bacterium]|nr:DUF3379 family protein [Pseudomonadota bacterium]
MNELQFRKQCIIDPDTADMEFQQALESAENHEFQQQCMEFDSKLADALNVEAPDDLAQRIIERNSAQKTGRSRSFSWNNWRPSLAAAASVAATMVFAVALLLRPQVALSEMVIDHLYDDINALHDRTVVTDAELSHILDHFDVEIERDSIGTLHFADICHIDKTDGIHVVYEGAKGPVTAIYLPGKKVKRLQAISRDQFQGIIFPYQEGAMAIIGLMGEDVLKQKVNVEKALLWKTADRNIQKAST